MDKIAAQKSPRDKPFPITTTARILIGVRRFETRSSPFMIHDTRKVANVTRQTIDRNGKKGTPPHIVTTKGTKDQIMIARNPEILPNE